jgi:hypothetical protein
MAGGGISFLRSPDTRSGAPREQRDEGTKGPKDQETKSVTS